MKTVNTLPCLNNLYISERCPEVFSYIHLYYLLPYTLRQNYFIKQLRISTAVSIAKIIIFKWSVL